MDTVLVRFVYADNLLQTIPDSPTMRVPVESVPLINDSVRIGDKVSVITHRIWDMNHKPPTCDLALAY
jgi:hypothetical protein